MDRAAGRLGPAGLEPLSEPRVEAEPEATPIVTEAVARTAVRPGGLLRARAHAILAPAGVTLDGGEPWDPQVRNERLFARVFTQGSLGLGEAYMDGWWDVEQMDVFFHRVLSAGLQERFGRKPPALVERLRGALVNLQRGHRAYVVGERHYDVGNDLYAAMLGRTMAYSCALWEEASDLDAAQEAKLELICRKLRLEPGMRLLDIGCGWGSLLEHAARRHGVEAIGITVSKQQAKFARQRCDGLPVEVRYADYRTLGGERFDRVVSVGMFEHVGPKNHRAYMQAAHRALAPGGLHLLHTIGSPRARAAADPWVSRYIFPNSRIPSMGEITRAADGLFAVEDLHGIGANYDPTLMAWCRNFDAAWPELAATRRYDERFRRMWRYYLLSAAGAFRAGKHHVWQIVMAKGRPLPGGYRSVR